MRTQRYGHSIEQHNEMSPTDMRIKHLVLATVLLGGVFAALNSAFAQPWAQTSAPITNWGSVACSAGNQTGGSGEGWLNLYFVGFWSDLDRDERAQYQLVFGRRLG